MTTWHPDLFSHWYAVARSGRLRRRPLGVTVLDRPIVLLRLQNGALMALEDRCPHRHAPLSAGCRMAHGIACPYHGWTFGADGELRSIPGMPPDVPLPPVRVRSFPIREHDGLVWLRPDASGLPDPPDLLRESQPRHRRFLWQTRWQAHVVDAMENFLDPLHTHSIHPGLVRRGQSRRPSVAAFRATASGFQVDYSGQAQSGLLYRLFESPRTLERAHFVAPGSARIEYRYAGGGSACITLHFTPNSFAQTEVFATLHVEGRWAPAWAVRLLVWPLLHRVAEQDRRILQLQSDNLRRFLEPRGASTQLDIVRASLERFWNGQGMPQPAEDRDVDLLL